MYKDLTTTEKYPKTLVIRNHEGGAIWQIYHVQEKYEAETIANGATNNGFEAITLEEHQPNLEETFPNWRKESESWLKIK